MQTQERPRAPYAEPVRAVLVALGSGERGIGEEEAAARLVRHGKNELRTAPPPGRVGILLRQFASPLILLLVVGGAIAVVLGDRRDASIIGVTVAVTVLFGFLQESKAERALRELRRAVRLVARVVRGGKERRLDARLLVPGDLVRVEAGDMVPADLRVLRGHDAAADEAPLTGESLPVEKGAEPAAEGAPLAERRSMLWQGTTLARGAATGVVVATGLRTEYGSVVRSLVGVRGEETVLQRELGTLTGFILRLVVAVGVFIAAAGFAGGIQPYDALLVALAVAVAAVPEGLTVTITAVLAVGMLRMARAKALTRRLLSVEALGAMSVLCVDKTGTLTEGRMRLRGASGDRERTFPMLLAAIAARVTNPAEPPRLWRTAGDPTERAILDGALAAGFAGAYRARRILDDLPFHADRRYRATIAEVGGARLLLVLGAPETVLAACTSDAEGGDVRPLDRARRTELEERLAGMAGEAVRTIALAAAPLPPAVSSFRDLGGALPPLALRSLVGLADPVRANAADAVHRLQHAGVRVLMVTGDTPTTAEAIARTVGIGGRALSLAEVPAARLTARRLQETDILARASSADKLRIVRTLQEAGEVVAMTGDGVNDAPALKQADIGVVMGSGQDVAKGIADLVLLDDNLGTVHRAVIEGRRLYANIRRLAVFLLYGSVVEAFVIVMALLLGLPLPLLPAQILWVNLIVDVFPAFAFAFEPPAPDLGRIPPRPKGEPLLTPAIRRFMLLLGAGTSIFLFALFLLLLHASADLAYVRTMVFVGLGINVFFVSLSLRSFRRPVFRLHAFGNPTLLAALGLGLALYAAAIYLPTVSAVVATAQLSVQDWLILLVFGAIHLFYAEGLKLATLRRVLPAGAARRPVDSSR